MKQRKVTMVCREIWRATVIVTSEDNEDLEAVKDRAWAKFDENKSLDLEQENFTKIEDAQDQVNENVKSPEFHEQ